MLRRQFAEELDCHIADAADELVRLGYSQSAATAEATKQFGDRAQIEQQLAGLHPWLSSYVDIVVGAVLLLSIIPLFLVHLALPTSTTGLVSEQLMLWWWFGAAMIGVALVVAWMLDVVGLTKKMAIVYAAALITEAALAITAIMDLNNFETAIDNIIFVTVCSLLVWVIWSQLTSTLKRAALFAILGITIAAALDERVVFPFLHHGCQFIYAETVLTGCIQVPFYSPSLWLVYAAALTTFGIVGWYIQQLWQSHAALHRKFLTTLACVSLPLVSLVQPNLNKLGDVDVIPWKRDIYATYQEILGRNPEEKDLDFYASTHAYNQMSRIREVLFASEERRIKINLLFQTTLGRDATAEELNHYANSYMSITNIQLELSNFNSNSN